MLVRTHNEKPKSHKLLFLRDSVLQNLTEDVMRIPGFETLIPSGVLWGTMVLVEFEPDSLWYPLASTIVSSSLKRGYLVDYHTLTREPDELRDELQRMGVEVSKCEQSGALEFIDYYAPSIGRASKEKRTISSLKLSELSLDLSRDLKNMTRFRHKVLHLDDNYSVVLQFNEERIFVQYIRDRDLLWKKNVQAVNLFGLTRGVHSEYLYHSLEDLAKGIIDIKTEEKAGVLKNLLRVRTMKGIQHDSSWHELLLERNGQVAIN